jgi:hypothetical protein
MAISAFRQNRHSFDIDEIRIVARGVVVLECTNNVVSDGVPASKRNIATSVHDIIYCLAPFLSQIRPDELPDFEFLIAGQVSVCRHGKAGVQALCESISTAFED